MSTKLQLGPDGYCTICISFFLTMYSQWYSVLLKKQLLKEWILCRWMELLIAVKPSFFVGKWNQWRHGHRNMWDVYLHGCKALWRERIQRWWHNKWTSLIRRAFVNDRWWICCWRWRCKCLLLGVFCPWFLRRWLLGDFIWCILFHFFFISFFVFFIHLIIHLQHEQSYVSLNGLCLATCYPFKNKKTFLIITWILKIIIEFNNCNLPYLFE